PGSTVSSRYTLPCHLIETDMSVCDYYCAPVGLDVKRWATFLARAGLRAPGRAARPFPGLEPEQGIAAGGWFGRLSPAWTMRSSATAASRSRASASAP